MITACEQSKNFVIPQVSNVLPFKDALLNSSAPQKIYFEPHGDIVGNIRGNSASDIIIGPEGGFTEEEESLIKSTGFKPYRLTKTILRSKEAITVGLGIMRSLI